MVEKEHMAVPPLKSRHYTFSKLLHTMSFFRRPDYTSEATQFIEQLKVNKPTLEAEQRAGRALLWDKNLNRADQADYLDGKVPQQAYVYGTTAHPNAK
jgi:Protein of unknown function (DUF3460)